MKCKHKSLLRIQCWFNPKTKNLLNEKHNSSQEGNIDTSCEQKMRGDSFQGTSEFQPTAFPIFTLDIKSQILFQGSHFSGGGGQREVWAGPKESLAKPENVQTHPRRFTLRQLCLASLGRVGGSLLAHQVLMRTPAEILTPAAKGPTEINDSPVLMTHALHLQDMPLNASLQQPHF